MQKILLTLLICSGAAFVFADTQEGLDAYNRGDYRAAAQYWQKDCTLDNGEACDSLAGLYIKGRGVPQDYAQARQYWQKACTLDNGEACGSLAGLYIKGKGVPQDYAQARQYYQKACRLGIDPACRILKKSRKNLKTDLPHRNTAIFSGSLKTATLPETDFRQRLYAPKRGRIYPKPKRGIKNSVRRRGMCRL